MPLVLYSEVAHLMPTSLREDLERDGNALFDSYEANAAQLIAETAGIDVPNAISSDNRPAWVIIPVAWVINHLLLQTFGLGMSEQYLTTARTNYDRALEIAKSKMVVSTKNTGDVVTRVCYFDDYDEEIERAGA